MTGMSEVQIIARSLPNLFSVIRKRCVIFVLWVPYKRDGSLLNIKLKIMVGQMIPLALWTSFKLEIMFWDFWNNPYNSREAHISQEKSWRKLQQSGINVLVYIYICTVHRTLHCKYIHIHKALLKCKFPPHREGGAILKQTYVMGNVPQD